MSEVAAHPDSLLESTCVSTCVYSHFALSGWRCACLQACLPLDSKLA